MSLMDGISLQGYASDMAAPGGAWISGGRQVNGLNHLYTDGNSLKGDRGKNV